MIGSPRARRVVVVGVVLLLAVAACGDDDAADPERFCEINTEIEEFDPFNGPPDEAREAAREVRSLIDEAVEVVPDEIRPSVEVAADSFRSFLDLFEAADFDVSQLDEADLEEAFSDEVEAATDAMDEWIDANCTT
ncbi:MAG: hypothetical protein V3V29_05705 [Acidimicrobiia bacterium]